MRDCAGRAMIAGLRANGRDRLTLHVGDASHDEGYLVDVRERQVAWRGQDLDGTAGDPAVDGGLHRQRAHPSIHWAPVARGRFNDPTFRFSGVADGQVLGCCQRVDGCRGVPMVGAASHRCRHRCRQPIGHLIEHGTIAGLRHELGGRGIFVPKPGTDIACHGLGHARPAQQCASASAGVRHWRQK